MSFRLAQQVRQHESAMSMATARVRGARTVLAIAQSFTSMPHAPSYLKSIVPVRSVDQAFVQAAERKAKEVLGEQVKKLQTLVGTPEFKDQTIRFRMDLRYLHPHLPQVVSGVLRQLDGMTHEDKTLHDAQDPKFNPERPRE